MSSHRRRIRSSIILSISTASGIHKAFYFSAEYRVAGPNPIEPSFEAKFARMQYAGGQRFHLSYMRYTGQWIQLYTDLTVDECIEAIRDDPYFSP